MPTSHPKINVLEGGWYVVYVDGSVTTMDEVNGWRNVPDKKDIHILGLKCRNKQFELEDKLWVPPGKTEISVSQGEGKIMITRSPQIGWFIGYYDQDNLCKVITRASKITGKFFQEEIPYVTKT